MYDNGAVASNGQLKPFSELTADEKAAEVTRLKRKSTEKVQEELLGKKRKTIPEIILNSKLQKSRNLFEKKYLKEAK